jgi:hypothetical protein
MRRALPTLIATRTRIHIDAPQPKVTEGTTAKQGKKHMTAALQGPEATVFRNCRNTITHQRILAF